MPACALAGCHHGGFCLSVQGCSEGGVPKEVQTALELLREAVRRKSADAAYALGDILQKGSGERCLSFQRFLSSSLFFSFGA